MLNFLITKTKVKAHSIKEVPIDNFSIVGIGQINPYCNIKYENELFVTVVSIAFDSKKYEEKEAIVLTKYFTVRKCPRCKKTELIPVKMRINRDKIYLAHEEEIAFDAYEEHPSRRHFPTLVSAYCNHCSSCFQIKIKNKDLWIKEALKIKDRDIITSCWEEYYLD